MPQLTLIEHLWQQATSTSHIHPILLASANDSHINGIGGLWQPGPEATARASVPSWMLVVERSRIQATWRTPT